MFIKSVRSCVSINRMRTNHAGSNGANFEKLFASLFALSFYLGSVDFVLSISEIWGNLLVCLFDKQSVCFNLKHAIYRDLFNIIFMVATFSWLHCQNHGASPTRAYYYENWSCFSNILLASVVNLDSTNFNLHRYIMIIIS